MLYIDIEYYILGNNFQHERELKGLTRAYLAQKLCCSTQQIQQIEEGGSSSFYTEAQKLKTARKLAHYLEMSEDQAFLAKDSEILQEVKISSPPPTIKTASNEITLGSKVGFATILIVLSSFVIYQMGLPDQKGYELTLLKPNQNQNNNINSSLPISESIVQNNDPCSIDTKSTSIFKADHPSDAGNFVVFQSVEAQKICFIEGNGHQYVVEIPAGQKKIVGGIAPFQVLGSNLSNIEIYYQGFKLSHFNQQLNHVELREVSVENRPKTINMVAVSQPSDLLNTSEQDSTSMFFAKKAVIQQQGYGTSVLAETMPSITNSPSIEE